MAGILGYSANNSGGYWWLNEKDWDNLEKEGWTVHWIIDDPAAPFGKKLREYDNDKLLEKREKSETQWLGAKAVSAAKRFDTKEVGIVEWERITDENAGDEGCNCCGEPHNFTWHDDDGSTVRSEIVVTSELNW